MCRNLLGIQTSPPGPRLSQGQSFPGASLDVFIDLFTFIYSSWKNLFFQFILTEHLLLRKEMHFLLNCTVSAVFNCENLRMFTALSRGKCNLNVKGVRIVPSIHLPTFTHGCLSLLCGMTFVRRIILQGGFCTLQCGSIHYCSPYTQQ